MQRDGAAAAGEAAGGPTSTDARVVGEWLSRCSSGGVHVCDTRGTRFVAWSTVRADVESVAAHLAGRGLVPGFRVGIWGHNSYEWLVLALSLLRMGVVPVAIPVQEFLGIPISDLVEDFGLSLVFAGPECREQQEDTTAAAALEALLDLVPATVLQQRGGSARERWPASSRPAFAVAFSSGTAGRTKRLLFGWAGVSALIEALSATYALDHRDRILIALPMSTFQQLYLCLVALRNGSDLALTTPARLLSALTSTRPTFMLGPPNFFDMAERRHANAPKVRRWLAMTGSELARLLPERRLRQAVRRRLYHDVHALYGGRMRVMLVGSAPVREETLRFFERAGADLFQIYGMTEVGYIAWNHHGANRVGTVGRAVYPSSVRLAEDGEVLVVSPWHICLGYEGETEADTAVVFPAPGVVATGDLGRLDPDGYLTVTGRKKNLVMTAGGAKLSLEDLEARLARASGVDHVVLYEVGGAALALVAWVGGGSSATARASLGSRVRELNTSLTGLAITRGRLMTDPLTPGSPHLNRNMKIDRQAVRRSTSDDLEDIERWT